MAKRKKSGSVLVFTLIIMSIILVIGLGIATVNVSNRQDSTTNQRSAQAIQAAGSSVEEFISEYNNAEPTENINDVWSGGANCNADGNVVKDGNELILKDKDGVKIDCSDVGKKIKDIMRVRSVGSAGSTERALEMEPPCAGVEFPTGQDAVDDDSSLIGYWPFDVTNKLKDLRNNNNATLEKEGSGADALEPSSIPYQGGKEAVVFNTIDSNPKWDKHNYAEIKHDETYASLTGTISFWFYSEDDNNDSWVPFSKDANCCDRRGDVKRLGHINYVDLDNDDSYDTGEESSGCGCVFYDDNYDCGHLVIGYNAGGAGPIRNFSDYTKDKFMMRFQNDGNGNLSDYALINGGNESGYAFSDNWHMVTLTYTTKAYSFYVDGQLMDVYRGNKGIWNNEDSDGLEAEQYNKFDINLGRHNGALNAHVSLTDSIFEGGIRELRIYNRALESCAVNRLYQMTD